MNLLAGCLFVLFMQIKINNSMNTKGKNPTQVIPSNYQESNTFPDPLSSDESSSRFCIPFVDCSSGTDRTVLSICVIMCFVCFICSYQCYESRKIDEDIQDLTSSNISRYSQRGHFEYPGNNIL